MFYHVFPVGTLKKKKKSYSAHLWQPHLLWNKYSCVSSKKKKHTKYLWVHPFGPAVHSSACRLCCRQRSEAWRLWTSCAEHPGSTLSIHHPSCFGRRRARVSTGVVAGDFYQLPKCNTLTFGPGKCLRGVAGCEPDQRWWLEAGRRDAHADPPDIHGINGKGPARGSKVKIISTVISTFPRGPCRGRGPKKKKKKWFCTL